MEQKHFIVLLILLMGFSNFLSVKAVPLSSSHLMADQDPIEVVDQMLVEEGMETAEDFIHGRMVIESTDYPGSGANNRHDPKPPGQL